MNAKKPEIEIRYSTEELPNEKELYVLGWFTLLSGQDENPQILKEAS